MLSILKVLLLIVAIPALPLGFNVAYSNPQPPAFAIRLSCSSPVLDKVKDQVLSL